MNFQNTSRSMYKILLLSSLLVFSWSLNTNISFAGISFDQPIEYLQGLSPAIITYADFDNDGDIDLATVHHQDGGLVDENNDGVEAVLIHLNNGDGSFTLGSSLYYGENVVSITSADFDGDGDIDLATANDGTDDVAILLNDGSGIFTLTSKLTADLITPTEVASADFDNDGDIDLATTVNAILDDRTSGPAIVVFNNDGTGNFIVSTIFLTLEIYGQSSPEGVVALDVNNDFQKDIVVTIDGTITAFSINNDGTLSNIQVEPSPESYYALLNSNTRSDIDGDGNIDMVVSTVNSGLVIYLQNNNGEFIPQNPIYIPWLGGNDPLIVTDLNNDSKPDIAIAAAYAAGEESKILIFLQASSENQQPTLDQIGNQIINEGDLLEFTVSASDPDGDELTFSATNTPTGSTFDPETGVFSWIPSFDDAGNYEDIEFTVMDNGDPMGLDVELITMTVGDVNRAPEITNPGPQEVLEGEELSFDVTATDPDNNSVTLSVTDVPAGATFNGTSFVWTPDNDQEGTYTLSFTATDDGVPAESSTIGVVITVGDSPTPVEQAEDIVEEVITIELPQNVENSYLANLLKVAEFINQGKINPAINQLNAFINKVTQDLQYGELTQTEADALIDAAESLLEDLQ